MIKTIMYDLDNTLCYCADWHYEALNMALKDVVNFEINKEDHIAIFNGLTTKTKLNILFKKDIIKKEDFDIISAKKQEYTFKLINENARLDPVKIHLHKQMKYNNITSVCVTNSITESACLILEKTGQLEYMEFVISNEQTKYPKPHGEGYIKAMVKLGVYPEETVIVEDSPHGIMAAKSTGAYVWEVRDAYEVTYDNLQKFIKSLKW